jgi:hypothetical protein
VVLLNHPRSYWIIRGLVRTYWTKSFFLLTGYSMYCSHTCCCELLFLDWPETTETNWTLFPLTFSISMTESIVGLLRWSLSTHCSAISMHLFSCGPKSSDLYHCEIQTQIEKHKMIPSLFHCVSPCNAQSSISNNVLIRNIYNLNTISYIYLGK